MVKKQEMVMEDVQKYLPVLRVTLGWMYFSAFLRRTVNVPDKLNPHSSAYVGGKLLTFIPHAWQPIVGQLEWFVSHRLSGDGGCSRRLLLDGLPEPPHRSGSPTVARGSLPLRVSGLQGYS